MPEVLRVGTPTELLIAETGGRIAARLGPHALLGLAEPPTGDPRRRAAAGREALRRGEVDVLLHRYGELPADSADDLMLAAVPRRADARDALLTREGLALGALPGGARIGVGSPRQRAQLLASGGALEPVDIAGEPAARAARLDSDDPASRLDGVLLPAAALAGLEPRPAAAMLELADWPSDPAQGALALEIRADASAETRRRVGALDHRASRLTAGAERAVLEGLRGRDGRGGGEALPLGAFAVLEDGLLFLTATLTALDGSSRLTASHAAYPEDLTDPAAELAARVVAELWDAGAAELLAGGRA